MSREYDAMKRLESETQIPLKRARPLCKGSPSIRTLQRYVTDGLYCHIAGARYFLEAFRGPGHSWWTSAEAVRRFWDQVNGVDR